MFRCFGSGIVLCVGGHSHCESLSFCNFECVSFACVRCVNACLLCFLNLFRVCVCVTIAIVNISYCGCECVSFTNVRRCVNVLIVLFSELVWCNGGNTHPK